MVRPALQLVIFHGSLDTLPEIIHRADDAGFEGVEFAYRLFESDPKTVARTLERTGLEPVGGHMTPEDLDERLETDLDLYRQIGCDRIVLSHFDDQYFESRQAIVDTARDIEAFADRVADHDLSLAYHNDGIENDPIDGNSTALETLVSQLSDDVSLQLDVKHALQGGLDPIDFLARHGERIDTVHFRDAAPDVDHSIALGQGEVDLDALIETAVSCDVDWLIYEGNHHMDTLAGAIDRIEAGLRAD